MYSLLRCPVCGKPFAVKDGSLVCPDRHTFDISRRGYVNLLTGSDASHGDNAMMTSARRAFLEAGYYENLAAAVAARVAAHAGKGAVILDEGCGEGYYTEKMCRAAAESTPAVYGFDISKEAIKAAAGRKCGATLFTASTYRVPMADAAADVVTLLFSPFCREEILRLLKKGGIFLWVVPGTDHLFSLKRAVYETPYKNAPQPTAIEGFSLIGEERLTSSITLPDAESIRALFSMTPYYYKTSEADHRRLEALTALETETDFLILTYRKN